MDPILHTEPAVAGVKLQVVEIVKFWAKIELES